jgi:tetratricopeptide (TPR) repeat protein
LVIAEKVLAKASEQEKIDILWLRATVLFEKAKAHEKLEQFAEAVENYRSAAADFRLTGNQFQVGVTLRLAGSISRSKLKDPHQAIELLIEAWPILQEEGRVLEATWARAELGWSYVQVGKYEEAMDVSADVM